MISDNFSLISLFLCIFFTAIGHYYFKIFFLKKSFHLLILAVVLFLFIPPLTYFSLKNLNLSTVYMSSAFANVLILLISKFFLKEEITINKYLGSVCVIFGIILFNL